MPRRPCASPTSPAATRPSRTRSSCARSLALRELGESRSTRSPSAGRGADQSSRPTIARRGATYALRAGAGSCASARARTCARSSHARAATCRRSRHGARAARRRRARRAVAALLLRRGGAAVGPLPRARRPPHPRPLRQRRPPTWRCSRRRASAARGWTWSFTMHGPTEFYDVTQLPARREGRGARRSSSCISDFARSQLMRLVEHGALAQAARSCTAASTRRVRAAPRPRAPAGRAARSCASGALVAVKGHVVLLEALGRAAPRAGVDVRADARRRRARARARCRAGAAALGLGERVELRRRRRPGRDPRATTSAPTSSACRASPRACPVVLMEAMAMELPVVATRIMGIPELVERRRERAARRARPRRPARRRARAPARATPSCARAMGRRRAREGARPSSTLERDHASSFATSSARWST